MLTPGVYIQEISTLGKSVRPVPTAIPVFIGYTQKTTFEGTSLANRAVRITSLNDFAQKFGDDLPELKFNISEENNFPDFHDSNGQGYKLTNSGMFFRLLAAMKFFYANGGSECYVVTIGDYNATFDRDDFMNAIDLLVDEPDPSILVIPEAILRDVQSAYDIQNHMIRHCSQTKNKFAILDVPEGYKDLNQSPNCIDDFRNGVGGILSENNSYAAAYYPWLHTSIHELSDIGFLNITSEAYPTIATLLTTEFTDPSGAIDPTNIQLISCFSNNGTSDDGAFSLEDADTNFRNTSSTYQAILGVILQKLNLIPPSAAMAGIYTVIDDQRGVWQTPANVVLQSVISPSVAIDNDLQLDLNAPADGKSICAIRAFLGRGNLVWGGRTMDGNSNEWRYINVRRTLIFIEQSVKESIKAFVFASNDANTWTQVETMISNFLNSLWREGALLGTKPSEAFSVNIGLGKTMTPQDIQNGIMRISLAIALMHPAEFVVISIEQKMQES
ncbi:MAG: phage tail sheath family protein [Flavobacterium sp.]|nr:MAG: phage tail sheath family protein [Flavobacterium sp.]